jgi:outer membrane protein insertion porin family
MLNGEIGWIESLGGKDVPFFRNYYVGGIGSVRGFDAGSLGRKDDYGDAYGGTRKLVLNAEYYFPLPGLGMDKTFRMSVFVDSGYVWDQDDSVKFNDMRVSTGIGFSWSSPLGPLKFSFAVPVRKDVGGSNYKDKTQNFQFQFGTMF